MSRLYDTVEPAVIDEDMLQAAVEEQGPKEEAGKIAKEEGINFKDVLALRLDFKNILKIDNLWCFTSLTKLQLDNNIIEKIEGLDSLVHLVWLDLSFNNIEVIEGLDKLTKIQDLTFFNNRISKIENLDSLTNLQVLSIGNNNIGVLENLLYLRQFRNLQTLTVSGNPVCDLDEFKFYTVAYLPQLQFLNYRLIDQKSKDAAFEKYENRVQELMHDERQKERKEKEEDAKRKELEMHQRAFIENLNGPFLFEFMYAEDGDGQKFMHIPQVPDMVSSYKEKFTTICQEIFNYGLDKYRERDAEVNLFHECIVEAMEENKTEAARMIDDFMSYKKLLWQEVVNITDSALLEAKVNDYHQRVTDLWDSLMGLEMQLVDQLDDAIKEFERNLSDMVAVFIENVQGNTSALRELENIHHQRMEELTMVTLERIVKGEVDEDMPEEVRELFVDKDTIVSAVQSSHDMHLLKIDNREDDMFTKIRGWLSSTMDNIHTVSEVQRNRKRVLEVNNLIDHLRDEIDNLDLKNQD